MYRLGHWESYLFLRRKGFDKDFVRKLCNASHDEPWRLGNNVKYVVEAHRRGASQEAILESVKDLSTEALALGLRRSQRAQAKQT